MRPNSDCDRSVLRRRNALSAGDFRSTTADSFLKFTSFVLGIDGGGHRYRKLVRCFIFVCQICALVYSVAYCWIAWCWTSFSDNLARGAFTYTCLHAPVIYMWRLQAGRLEKWRARFDRPTSILLTILFCLLVALCCCTLYDLQAYAIETKQGTVFSVIGEAAFFLCQVQNTLICIEMATHLNSEADRIDSELENPREESGRKCHRMAARGVQLSRTFAFPLNMLHLLYFCFLISQIPVKVVWLTTSGVDLYNALNQSRQLLEVLIVVMSGNRVLQKRRKFRKELKKTADFFSTQVNVIQAFAKQDCGLTFALGASLSFRSFFDFISVSWGFTLMVVQLSFESKAC